MNVETLFNRFKHIKVTDVPQLYKQAISNKPEEFKQLDAQLWSLSQLNTLTKEDIVRIVEWKLKALANHRGKFRPRLLSLVRSNSSSVITTQLQTANKLLTCLSSENIYRFDAHESEIKKIIKVLSELKGVGPATASAIAMLLSPHVAFFSDEAYTELTGKDGIKYTIQEYMVYIEVVYALARKFREIDLEWDARTVEKMVWSHVVTRDLQENEPITKKARTA